MTVLAHLETGFWSSWYSKLCMARHVADLLMKEICQGVARVHPIGQDAFEIVLANITSWHKT